ncbi:MAG: hypothetical protein C5B59_17495 [Bacteroidetes bacterium]|nr:MAG: hypothetical protein C5B59_17495 [Bacteroidota bacterium]
MIGLVLLKTYNSFLDKVRSCKGFGYMIKCLFSEFYLTRISKNLLLLVIAERKNVTGKSNFFINWLSIIYLISIP